jgi:hypothetical protein
VSRKLFPLAEFAGDWREVNSAWKKYLLKKSVQWTALRYPLIEFFLEEE